MTVILQQEALRKPQLASTPTRQHVAVHRQQARMMSDEELHKWRDDAGWLLVLADAEKEDYPLHVTENSRLNALAVIAAVDAELGWRASKGITKPPSGLGWPSDFLDTLKARVCIEDEISRSVLLRRSGKSLKGLCPLHHDRNPSLVVWPDSGRWRCFGCGEHGDVFDWIEATGRMSFSESVHYLAAVADVDMPRKPQQARRRVVTIGGR